MKETTTKIGHKTIIAVMVAAAAVIGMICWVTGLGSRKKEKKNIDL